MATSAPPPVRRFTSATTSHCFGSSTTSAPMCSDIFIRTGSFSTPIMTAAPINFAPAVAQSPIGPCAKTTTVSPMRMSDGAAQTGRCDVREQNYLLVSQLIGNLGEVGLSVRHKEIFGLRTIDGVAKTPAADCFHAFAVSALCPLRRQTGPTLSARRDRTDQYSISDLISGYAFPQLFNHPDRRLPDYESRFHCIFAAQNMKIGSADGR